MSDMTKNPARTIKEKTRDYEFGPLARDACWTSFVSSLNRLLEETDSIQQGICDSSNHVNEFEDVDKCKSDISSSYSSDTIYNSQNGSGETTTEEADLLLPQARYPKKQTAEQEELCNLPPEHYLVEQPDKKSFAQQPVKEAFAQQPVKEAFAQQPVKEAFAEQPPPEIDSCAGDQVKCLPVAEYLPVVEYLPIVDYTPPLLSIRKSDYTNNNVNKNDSDRANVKATPKPEREPDLLGAEQVADSVGPTDVVEDECKEYLPVSSECLKSSVECQTSFSECRSFVPCMLTEHWSPLMDCIPLRPGRSPPMIVNSSSCSLASDIEYVPTVVPGRAPLLYAEAERLVLSNRNYSFDSDESCVLEQHPIAENLFMEIDKTIEWYSKVFLVIVLFVLISFLL